MLPTSIPAARRRRFWQSANRLPVVGADEAFVAYTVFADNAHHEAAGADDFACRAR